MILLTSFAIHSVDLDIVGDFKHIASFVGQAVRFLHQTELLGCLTVEQALPMCVQIGHMLSEVFHRFVEAIHPSLFYTLANSP